jgi:hypothetical protein
VTPFKVQVNFYISLFQCQIDVDTLENWLNLLKGYFLVYNFSNREKITFALLNVVPRVKYWWETFYKQNFAEESRMLEAKTTWASFVDAIKEKYYPIGNYDDQYTRWTTLRQVLGLSVHEFES